MTETNPDGLPEKSGNVPLAAGMAAAGSATIHDKDIPEFVEAAGKKFNLHDSFDYHERIERALMGAGFDYMDAHRCAQECEHARQREMGFDPNEIEKLAAPFIDMAAHRAKAEGASKVYAEPYKEEGESGLLSKDDKPKPQTVRDNHGNEYTAPERFRIMDRFDAILCKGSGKFCVIEPTSAMVIGHGMTAKGAKFDADQMVKKRGALKFRAWIEQQPQMSQQQLDEIYGDAEA